MLAELTERLANATSIEANASLDDIWVTLTAAWPTEGFAVQLRCLIFLSQVFADWDLVSFILFQPLSKELMIRDSCHGASFRAKDEQIIGGEGRTKVSLAVSG